MPVIGACSECGIDGRLIPTYWDEAVVLCSACCGRAAGRFVRSGWPDVPAPVKGDDGMRVAGRSAHQPRCRVCHAVVQVVRLEGGPSVAVQRVRSGGTLHAYRDVAGGGVLARAAAGDGNAVPHADVCTGKPT